MQVNTGSTHHYTQGEAAKLTPEENARFYQAIVGGGLDEVEHFLTSPGFDFATPIHGKCTPLHLAAMHGRSDVVQAMLARGGDNPAIVNAYSIAGYTPLMYAAQSGHAEVVNLLCDARADIEARQRVTQSSPLMLAAANGHVETVRVLRASGADLEAVDRHQKTALAHAAAHGQCEMMKVLYDLGAELETPRNTVMQSAIGADRADSMKCLLELGVDIEFKSRQDGATPLLKAATCAPEVVKVLLDAGANVHATDYRGYTAVLRAAEHNKAEVIAVLAAHRGVDIEARSRHDVDPLHKPVHIDGPRHLGFYRSTAVIVATLAGNLKALDALLAANAQINVRNDEGHTPLMLAVLTAQPQMVAALCARGANTEWTDGDGLTGLMLGMKLGVPTSVVHALIAGGANLNVATDTEGRTALMFAVVNGNSVMIPVLHQGGADLDVVDGAGHSALTLAISQGDLQTVKLLLSLGARPDAKPGGISPLTTAITLGRGDMVSALIEAEADVDARDAHGMTPMMVAARDNNVDIMRTLRAAGADILAKTAAGQTAKAYARAAGAEEAVAFLVASGDDAGDRFLLARARS